MASMMQQLANFFFIWSFQSRFGVEMLVIDGVSFASKALLGIEEQKELKKLCNFVLKASEPS